MPAAPSPAQNKVAASPADKKPNLLTHDGDLAYDVYRQYAPWSNLAQAVHWWENEGRMLVRHAFSDLRMRWKGPLFVSAQILFFSSSLSHLSTELIREQKFKSVQDFLTLRDDFDKFYHVFIKQLLYIPHGPVRHLDKCRTENFSNVVTTGEVAFALLTINNNIDKWHNEAAGKTDWKKWAHNPAPDGYMDDLALFM